MSTPSPERATLQPLDANSPSVFDALLPSKPSPHAAAAAPAAADADSLSSRSMIVLFHKDDPEAPCASVELPTDAELTDVTARRRRLDDASEGTAEPAAPAPATLARAAVPPKNKRSFAAPRASSALPPPATAHKTPRTDVPTAVALPDMEKMESDGPVKSEATKARAMTLEEVAASVASRAAGSADIRGAGDVQVAASAEADEASAPSRQPSKKRSFGAPRIRIDAVDEPPKTAVKSTSVPLDVADAVNDLPLALPRLDQVSAGVVAEVAAAAVAWRPSKRTGGMKKAPRTGSAACGGQCCQQAATLLRAPSTSAEAPAEPLSQSLALVPVMSASAKPTDVKMELDDLLPEDGDGDGDGLDGLDDLGAARPFVSSLTSGLSFLGSRGPIGGFMAPAAAAALAASSAASVAATASVATADGGKAPAPSRVPAKPKRWGAPKAFKTDGELMPPPPPRSVVKKEPKEDEDVDDDADGESSGRSTVYASLTVGIGGGGGGSASKFRRKGGGGADEGVIDESVDLVLCPPHLPDHKGPLVMERTLANMLRPHQRAGCTFIAQACLGLKALGKGCLLADDMVCARPYPLVSLSTLSAPPPSGQPPPLTVLLDSPLAALAGAGQDAPDGRDHLHLPLPRLRRLHA